MVKAISKAGAQYHGAPFFHFQSSGIQWIPIPGKYNKECCRADSSGVQKDRQLKSTAEEMRANSKYKTLAGETGKNGAGRMRECFTVKVAYQLSLQSP